MTEAQVKAIVRLEKLADHELTARQLEERYSPNGDGEHPTYTRERWRGEVNEQSTISGYWKWVNHQLLNEVEG